jgi:hypothetical protein
MGMLVAILKTLGVVAAFAGLVLWIVGAVSLARFSRHRWSRLVSTDVEALRPPGTASPLAAREAAAAALKRRALKCMLAFIAAIAVSAAFAWLAGDEIEEPFGLAVHHLPLTALCRTIEINLREALGDPALPAPLVAVDHQLD